MLNVFQWLRAQVKAAILSGVADAVGELDGADQTEAVALLQQRLQALPAPSENGHEVEPAAGRGRRAKKEDVQ